MCPEQRHVARSRSDRGILLIEDAATCRTKTSAPVGFDASPQNLG
jgi:hypothetical protein